jgi:hypothetical protein
LNSNAIGLVTSDNLDLDNSLTFEELSAAFNRRYRDGSTLDSIDSLVTGNIELQESAIEPAREIPGIGFAELHRDFYVCEVTCLTNEHKSKKLNIRIEKNHFHLVVKD